LLFFGGGGRGGGGGGVRRVVCSGAMRRSVDLLVFASGDAIGDEEAENGAFGCEVARLISSLMGVLGSKRLSVYRDFPGAGVSLV
jgi:hypothetical protein